MRFLILGPPGTGKTTRLIETVKSLNCPLSQVAFVSFTKTALAEAKERMLEQFPDANEKTDLQGFRTLHSFCYQLAGMKPNQIISQSQIKDFEKKMGQDFEIETEVFSLDRGRTDKNTALYLYHLSINLCRTIEEVHSQLYENCSVDQAVFISKSYEAYKKSKGVFDFNDLLLYCAKNAEPLNYKYVILDEAQDLTTLQWVVFERIFQNAQDIYIAGDDDQSIYTWAGVNVQDFLSVKHDQKTILSESFRISKEAHDFSSKISNRIKNRFEKVFTPAKHSGTVVHIVDLDEIKDFVVDSVKKGQTWFFLFRNAFFMRNAAPFLHDAGLPFLWQKTSSVLKQDIDAIIAFEKLRKSKNIAGLDELTKLLLTEYVETITEKTLSEPWFFAFEKMSIDKREYYRNIKANGFKLLAKPLIELSTIHQAKGREAENVVLFPDMTRASFDHAGEDDEHRVFYVAATRVKRNLFICEPQGGRYYEFD